MLRATWFFAIPLCLSGSAVRYLVPHSLSAGGLESALTRFARDHAPLCGLAVFMLTSSLLNYWRAFLPGGRYVSSLPAMLAARVPRHRLSSAERAWATLNFLETRAGRGWLAGSDALMQSSVLSAQQELIGVLARGKWSRLGFASEQLRRLSARPQRAFELKKNIVFAVLLTTSALLALQLRAHYFQAYEVIGTSMLPTLTPGELLAGRVRPYDSERLPARGEIVVLHANVDGMERELIKRVIGLPGDQITMRGGVPVINGWTTPACDAGAYYSPHDETARHGDPGGRVFVEFLGGEPYLTFQTMFAVPFQSYWVKPGEVFVLGDNRSNSRDSRALDRGAPSGVPLSAIRGTVTRSLFARTRRGELDMKTVLRPIGVGLNVEGADLSQVESGIQRCLALRPAQTTPPRAASGVAFARQ